MIKGPYSNKNSKINFNKSSPMINIFALISNLDFVETNFHSFSFTNKTLGNVFLCQNLIFGKILPYLFSSIFKLIVRYLLFNL